MSYSPWIGNLVVGGRLGNYGTVKWLLDEQSPASTAQTLEIEVQIAGSGVSPDAFEVQVFTNLNRRDFAKLQEPLAESENPASSYWLAYPMQFVGRYYDNLVFKVTLPVTHCGAYRVTTRYRRVGQSDWWWQNQFSPWPGDVNHRDCAVVVSPAKASALSLYEANALTVEAMQGGDYQNRSTLDDFLPEADFDGFNPFDLGYVRNTLGFNTLWLMPVFPVTRWRWDPQGNVWASNENPGSPYSARDYFSINPWLADDATSARAMELFQRVVNLGHDMGLDVFLDMALNHAGRDVCYGQGAVDLGLVTSEHAGDWIREVHPTWCTRGSEFYGNYTVPHYREFARDGYSCAVFAPADRLMEHRWYDANVDWYFGNYSALGPKPGVAQSFGVYDPQGNAEDERDFFYTNLNEATDTANLWRYFARILPFWLEKTQQRLAGIRADFAQGLPNQLWEYLINVTRQSRWDFVFLAEVLDPPGIQYRLNKVFDVLTTLWHGKFRDNDLTMGDLFGIFEGEASLFGGQAVVMHNATSHDESGNPNKWAMVARYAVGAAAYGASMVFMGQPLGLANKLDFQSQWTNLYDAWVRDDPERAPVAEMYRRINRARADNAELRGAARYFLNLMSGGFHGRIFSIARWASAASTDSVLLVFVNLNPWGTEAGNFAIPRSIRLNGKYQAHNLVADNPTAPLWNVARDANDIYDQGVYVLFHYPNEVQFIRLQSVS
jgi:hypothetical protein